MPSTVPESFGLVALEAMLACKPVIASNLGALKEVVKNNTTGFLFDINDKKDFEKKIQILLENKELREEYGIAGYSRAKKTFNIEKYIYQFEQKYLED